MKIMKMYIKLIPQKWKTWANGVAVILSQILKNDVASIPTGFCGGTVKQREPDTYVMKSVSFGDKPAGNIAIIALNKTAEMSKSEFPEAVVEITHG